MVEYDKKTGRPVTQEVTTVKKGGRTVGIYTRKYGKGFSGSRTFTPSVGSTQQDIKKLSVQELIKKRDPKTLRLVINKIRASRFSPLLNNISFSQPRSAFIRNQQRRPPIGFQESNKKAKEDFIISQLIKSTGASKQGKNIIITDTAKLRNDPVVRALLQRTNAKIKNGTTILQDTKKLRNDPVFKALVGGGIKVKEKTSKEFNKFKNKPKVKEVFNKIKKYTKARKDNVFITDTAKLRNINSKLGSEASKLRSERKPQLIGQTPVTNPKEDLALIGTAVALSIGKVGELPGDLVETAKILSKDPKKIKDIPKAQANAIKEFGNVVVISPTEALARVGTDLLLLKGFDKGIRAVEVLTKPKVAKIINTLDPKGRRIISNEFGEEYIKGVPKVPKGEIELIPPGKKPKLNVDAEEVLKKTEIPLKENPTIPRLNKKQKAIINIVKKRDDSVTGSLAQRILLKKPFTRKFKDIDILARNPKALAQEIKRRLGRDITIRKSTRSYQIFSGKKQIADIVKREVGEEGLAVRFGTKKVKGLNVVKPQARLGAKVKQLGRGKKGKVLKDIKLLSGKKIDLNKPTIRGAFGYSKKELKALVGKEGPIVTSQVDLLGRGIFKPKELELKKWLFASPPSKAGKAQTRITRLGVTSEEEAGFLDLLSGNIKFRSGKPQIFVFSKEKIFPKSAKGKGFRVPFKSSELEVILDKGFTITRGKRLASTVIQGKRVPIYEIKKTKLSKLLTKNELKLLNSLKKGSKLKKPSNIKIRELNSKLKRKTGFDYGIGKKTSKINTRKVFNVKSKVGSSLLSAVKSLKSKSRLPSGGSGRSPGRTPSRLPSGGSGRSPLRYPPSKKGAPSTPVRLKAFKSKLPKGKNQAYDVYAKRKGKLMKVNTKPLSLSTAKDKLAFTLDNTLSRTAEIRPVGRVKKLGSIPKAQKGSFRKLRKNLRESRIIRGKSIRTPLRYIEKKGKPVISTRGEKAQLKISRARSTKRAIRRVKSPSYSRTAMLNNLKKARAVRMKNIKNKGGKR